MVGVSEPQLPERDGILIFICGPTPALRAGPCQKLTEGVDCSAVQECACATQARVWIEESTWRAEFADSGPDSGSWSFRSEAYQQWSSVVQLRVRSQLGPDVDDLVCLRRGRADCVAFSTFEFAGFASACGACASTSRSCAAWTW